MVSKAERRGMTSKSSFEVARGPHRLEAVISGHVRQFHAEIRLATPEAVHLGHGFNRFQSVSIDSVPFLPAVSSWLK